MWVDILEVLVPELRVAGIQKREVVVKFELVHLDNLPKARVDGGDVFLNVVLGKAMDIIPTLGLDINFAQIDKELLCIVFIEAVAHLQISLVFELPRVDQEVLIVYSDTLHPVGHLIYKLRLLLHLFCPDDWNFGRDIKPFSH